MIKTLIFDMGGVLVDLDLDACRQEFLDNLEYKDIDSILDACHQKGIFGQMEEGLISADEFRAAVLAGSRAGMSPSDVDNAVWKILKGIEPYKAELLKRLSCRYDLYMLSNNNPICMVRAYEIFEEAGIPIDRTFRKCYISCQMKAMKPSAAFYRTVMDDILCGPDEMLFIDDSPRNVKGAVDAGLPAVCYEPGSDLEKFMADVLHEDFNGPKEEERC